MRIAGFITFSVTWLIAGPVGRMTPRPKVPSVRSMEMRVDILLVLPPTVVAGWNRSSLGLKIESVVETCESQGVRADRHLPKALSPGKRDQDCRGAASSRVCPD